MTGQTVRPLLSDDQDQWVQMWADYNAFYGRTGATALSEQVVRTTWCRLLDVREPVFGFVFEGEKQLLGLAHCVLHRNLIRSSDTCYMQDLFTVPQSRGRGVGRALILAIKDFCHMRGIQDMYWHTQSQNLTARRLYDDIARDTDFLVYRCSTLPTLRR